MNASDSLYHCHRFPPEIISHCVWLYFRFSLSFRDVEELMSSRGVALTYETVREWCLKFGQTYANGLRRKSPLSGDRWHLDEVFLKIDGRPNNFGVRLIRMAMCWIFSFRVEEIKK
jgi:putative transposase